MEKLGRLERMLASGTIDHREFMGRALAAGATVAVERWWFT